MKSSSNKKRFLAILLMLAMVISIFPANVALAGGKSYSVNLKTKNKLIKYDAKTKSVTVVNKAPFGFDLKTPLASGDTIKVTVKGTYNGSKGFRMWLIDKANQTTTSNQVDKTVLPSKPGKFTATFELTATGVANQIFFKGPDWQDQNIDNLTISSIKIAAK